MDWLVKGTHLTNAEQSSDDHKALKPNEYYSKQSCYVINTCIKAWLRSNLKIIIINRFCPSPYDKQKSRMVVDWISQRGLIRVPTAQGKQGKLLEICMPSFQIYSVWRMGWMETALLKRFIQHVICAHNTHGNFLNKTGKIQGIWLVCWSCELCCWCLTLLFLTMLSDRRYMIVFHNLLFLIFVFILSPYPNIICVCRHAEQTR